jgi:hypothetical protein
MSQALLLLAACVLIGRPMHISTQNRLAISSGNTDKKRRRRRAGFILPVEEPVSACIAVSSLLAQQYHGISRQRPARWNPRSQKPQQRHR